MSVGYYKRLGFTVRKVMADNGPCYTSKAFAAACKEMGIRHVRTKPYTPRTNGKAERFIQTALKEWAYARTYQSSDERAADFPAWIHLYNWHRPHSAIGSKPPISRLGMDRENLLRHHSHLPGNTLVLTGRERAAGTQNKKPPSPWSGCGYRQVQ